MFARPLVLALAVGLLGNTALAADDISSTKHNLSTSGTGSIKLASAPGADTDKDQLCSFCHTPHFGDASVGVVLWNRSVNTSGYTMYSSSSIDMTIASQPQGVSLACLSCHDGTIAFDNLRNGPGAGDYNGNTWSRGWSWTSNVNKMSGSASANVGQDLSNDHPVSVTYDNTADTAFYSATAVTSAGLRLYGSGGNQVECGSCHNPHNNTYAPFLRINNQGSALCLTCHVK